MGGNAVSVDEKHYKSRGKFRWMVRAMCMTARSILASYHWSDKLNHGAARCWKRWLSGWEYRHCYSETRYAGTRIGVTTR